MQVVPDQAIGWTVVDQVEIEQARVQTAGQVEQSQRAGQVWRME